MILPHFLIGGANMLLRRYHDKKEVELEEVKLEEDVKEVVKEVKEKGKPIRKQIKKGGE